MPMFWSTKPKAEKNYADAAAKPKTAKRASSARKDGAKTKTTGVVNTKVVKTAKVVPTLPAGAFGTAADVIIRPRITEKSGVLSQSGVYTFEVKTSANKQTVAKAIKALYKVTPTKITMINQPAKNVFVKGRRGVVSGFRKALVTVKKGDKIDFV